MKMTTHELLDMTHYIWMNMRISTSMMFYAQIIYFAIIDSFQNHFSL